MTQRARRQVGAPLYSCHPSNANPESLRIAHPSNTSRPFVVRREGAKYDYQI
jgi:hypothetical protein